MGKEMHIGVYLSDDPHTMKEYVAAQVHGGRCLGIATMPCDYKNFGQQVMENILEGEDVEGLEKIFVHPGNYLGIGPCEPFASPIAFGLMVGGMKSHTGISCLIDALPEPIDLDPPTEA